MAITQLAVPDQPPRMTPERALALKDKHRQHQDLLRTEGDLTRRVKACLRRVLESDDLFHGIAFPTATDKRTGKPQRKSPYAKLGEKELHARILERFGELGALDALKAIVTLKASRQVIHDHQMALRKELEREAGALRVWSWAEEVRGFGALGLAQIMAETTTGTGQHLSNYAGPAKVWKRMGLAVLGDGTRQRAIAGTDGDEAYAIGYNPRRRSIMYVIGDSLIKGNGDGVYRRAYAAYKEKQRALHPELSDMVTHLRAQRYMEKLLLKHLWQAWRNAEVVAV